MHYIRGGQKAARRPHVARERVQGGPRTSEKIKISKEILSFFAYFSK
jgi:hypothetical protein